MLPNVERYEFCIRDGRLFFVRDGKLHCVEKLLVIANGTRDLCVALDDKGRPNVVKISDVGAERILSVPKGDLLWVQFVKPIDGRYWSVLFEMDDVLRRMLRVCAVLGLMGVGVKGDLFDMHAGADYDFCLR